MAKDYELTALVLRYKRGEVAYEDISGKISLFIYGFPYRAKHWNQDLCSDFFEFFYPRMRPLVESYKEIGYSFESYVEATVKQQMKTFLKKRREEEQKEKIYSRMCIQEYKIHSGFGCAQTAENEPAYCPGKIGQRRTRRRLLFLAFTDPEHLDDSMLERLSEVTGYALEYLRSCCLVLKEKIQRKKLALQELTEKKNAQYFKLLMLQADILNEGDEEKRCWLTEQLRKIRDRIDDLVEQISVKSQYLVSHDDLAKLFGVSKGTVDSGIFYLRKQISPSGDKQFWH